MHLKTSALAAALTFHAASALAGSIVLNEIHYAPRDKTVPEELVELFNNGPDAVDLGGWYFSDGISFSFPDNTVLAPGEYLVVAQDPQVLTSLYPGIRAVGPFRDRLSNDGESIVLRNKDGGREDEVDYRRGFPWPTVGGAAGYSIELIHPDLDNDLGGSWRASNPSGGSESGTLVGAGQPWKYWKGTAEASTPASAWRAIAFNETGWSAGSAPVGYGEGFIATPLPDMQGGYSSFFLRKTFEVSDPAQIPGLAIEALYDDGFNAWINGTHVLNANMPSAEVAYNGLASTTREDLDFTSFPLPRPASYLVQGTNVIAVQVHNILLGSSSDAFFDARLVTSTGAGAGPTPGSRNSVYAINTPPILRQVDHSPRQPVSGEPVLVTVKATDPDGVSGATLEYQLVDPGAYIELGDPQYAAQWTPAAMNDAGTGGDAAAGDDVYSVLLPGTLQTHRRLVRYRITVADLGGRSIRAPYSDDPQPNFAYFVHDGFYPWSGAIQPTSSDPQKRLVVEYSSELMGKLPVYHLISKKSSVEDSTWFSRYGGDNYPWRGTLVYQGDVYDHIGYRARGGVWRYAMGKNMWKFDFLTGHPFRARDDFGREVRTRWTKLNFSACIQQGDYLHRGEQGMFEAAGFKLFNLAGEAASLTNWVTFRIIDEAQETGPTQYDGDFWGLYLVIEQLDGRFLDEHGLPDGNFYKMEGGTGELNNLGPAGPKDKSDLNAFLNTYTNTTPPDDWWRENLELERYYNYRSVIEAIHHGDVGYGKNYFYYLHPETQQWAAYPWDLDLTWADNMFGDGNEPFKSRVLTRPAFSLEYRNRIREIRDLLYNTTETYKLIDELAAVIDDPAGGPSIVDADRARWDYSPILTNSSIVNLSKAGQGRFYQQASTKDFPGMVQMMKSYVLSRGSWIDTNIAADAAMPRRPTITYAGPAGHPIDQLTFQSSAFSDPQGNDTFGGMKWRAAEVTAPGAPPFDPASPKLFEIHAAWESPELSTFSSSVTLPSSAFKIGHTYRARVRMKDTSGRWSNWSAPVELTVGQPTVPFPQQADLRITELHYHPKNDLDEEFIELLNTGAGPLDLTPVSFTEGIDFRFADGAVATLGPGERLVVVQNLVAFRARYGSSGILVAGEVKDRLSNGGERIVLTYGGNATIQDFAYDDAWYPLADGGGSSLEVIDPTAPLADWSDPANWRESVEDGGTPGAAGGGGPPGGRQTSGDANQNGVVEIGDAVSIAWRLFVGGIALPCDGSALNDGGNIFIFDVDGNGFVNITDAIFLLNYLFTNGAVPARGTSCARRDGCADVCN